MDKVVGAVPLGNPTTQTRACRLAIFLPGRGGIIGGMEKDCWRLRLRSVQVACTAYVWSGGPVVLGRPHPHGHARRGVGHSQCRQGLLPLDARVVVLKTDAPPSSGGLVGGGARGAFQYRSEERPVESVAKMGPSGICETLHLSDALGLGRVRLAQRDGKEANPSSPRVPRAQSTTASRAAKENTGSWSVTGHVLGGLGRQVERLMRLPDVPRKREGLVAGGLMALGRLAATIDPQRGLARLTQALETISEEGLSQASEESYYDDDELEPVSVQLARRGIGEVGKVRMADTIWRRCVPKDLLRTYQAWDRKYASGIPMVDSPAVGDMLSAIRDAGPLKKCSQARGTSKARVIPKNSQKCALIFACVGLNDANWRKPPKFRLPKVEQVTRLMADAGHKVFLGKIDVSNCFWSIHMPYKWCRVFRVNTPQGCFC